MEVLIKKSKLTASIIEQMPGVSPITIDPDKVIGFCYYKGAGMGIQYDPQTNAMYKLRAVKTQEVKLEANPNAEYPAYVYIVWNAPKLIPAKINFTTEAKAREFSKKLDQWLAKAKELGQFYI